MKNTGKVTLQNPKKIKSSFATTNDPAVMKLKVEPQTIN